MSTRAAAASLARKATQNLVRILFKEKRRNRAKLDYSYDELRLAFLKRAHELHPDKAVRQGPETRGKINSSFVELRSAWDAYEKYVKTTNNVPGKQPAFTMFGVGCSFADNEIERTLREEITDQACRGWFSSGSIGSSQADGEIDDKDKDEYGMTSTRISFVDDSDFVVQKDVKSSGERTGKTLVDIHR